MVNTKKYSVLIAGLTLLFFARCRQPYVPPASSTDTHYLVVEGLINTGSGPTTIKLSRNVKLTDSINSPELNASVSIESDASATGTTVLKLNDAGSGKYTAVATGLNAANNYRLRIITSGGKVYLSDFVPVKTAPPIDSINFEIKPEGMYLYSYTHDATNNSRYYRWDYTETWLIHSRYESYYEKVYSPVNAVTQRPPQDQIWSCWPSDASTSITLNSSAKLSQDIITHNLVAFVPSTSEKLRIEYSITLNQYALTADAFNYWQNLKKNTESLGSVFDALPSQMSGNIHSADNSSELVLGYISAGAASQKIFFIGNSSIPQIWERTVKLPYDGCLLDSLYFKNPKTGGNDVDRIYTDGEQPVHAIVTRTGVLLGYDVSSLLCVDCRVRGTNVRPSFWIDKY